jgi:hypothetical protein
MTDALEAISTLIAAGVFVIVLVGALFTAALLVASWIFCLGAIVVAWVRRGRGRAASGSSSG